MKKTPPTGRRRKGGDPMFRRLAQLKKAGGKLSRRLPGSFENGKRQ
jgi:hypothetical protein